MPQYIKVAREHNLPASNFKAVKDGLITLEQAWASLKNMFPLYTGGLHTPNHEEYTRDIIKTISDNNTRDDQDELDVHDKVVSMGVYSYVEDVEHDEDYKTLKWTMIAYIKDEELYDLWLEEHHKTNAYRNKEISPDEYNSRRHTKEIVHFHKPYKS